MLRNMLRDPVVRRLVVFFLLTRAALLGVGLTAYEFLPPGKGLTGDNLRFDRETPAVLDIWARWDSEWYLLIAENGYDSGNVLSESALAYEPEDTAGFFPLYPALVRALTPLTGPVAGGLLISNLALMAALLLILGLARDLWGERFGSRAGLAAGAALLVGPFTLFHSAVYAESLFLALSLAVLFLARRDRFAWAGLAAAFATLSRPFGALLVIPLIIEWWQSRHRSRWGWTSIFGIGIGLGLYMLYCYGLFGDALAFVDRQNRWRGAMGLPGMAFLRWWQAGPTLHGAHGSTVELAVALAFLTSLPMAFRRLRPSLAFYLAAGVLLPLCSSLWSFGRITSTLFPIYLLLGMTWAEGHRRWPLAGATICGLFALVAMALFAAGWWVG
ncbi:MAG: hypothetical protein K8R59_16960 [Thermoanaerobaculales bacterium]|nr:hypothetical protein [Thermoanaerobaculales bacterium]